MRYDVLPGIDLKPSRMVLGTYGLNNIEASAPVLDAYVEQGGNCADTAYAYSGGASEATLGVWMESRGVRDDFAVIGKGAHTPNCWPEKIGEQLKVSLDRLRTDHVDLYMLHRDNPEVPVGEFVEALEEQRKLGRLKACGASNWSLQRVEEANAYARDHGLPGFVAVSNHLSLAEMVEEPWPGCVASSDPKSRTWLAREGLALFPWSTMAHGFFAPGGTAAAERGEGAARSWWSPTNVARARRADQLAAEIGVSSPAVVVAFVLSQPFATFPLIGPLTVEELSSSLVAADVELTADQVEWLLVGDQADQADV